MCTSVAGEIEKISIITEAKHWPSSFSLLIMDRKILRQKMSVKMNSLGNYTSKMDFIFVILIHVLS